MTNQDRIVFCIAPVGHGKNWVLDNSELLFKLDNKPKIYFRFGSPQRIDLPLTKSPFPRIRATVNDQTTKFKNSDFIYHGWELIECVEELYNEYPHAEFFVIAPTFEDNGDATVETFTKRRSNNQNSGLVFYEEAVRERIKAHYKLLHDFLENKTLTTFDISHIPRSPFPVPRYNCYYINKPSHV
jgi:hypothetical protein